MPETTISRTISGRDEFSSLGSVLIIDDEAAIRESLQTLLDLEGYEVETANDGNEGLARLADRPFDLVLLDFALPERNGIEVLRDIRERDSELPVIMITAYGTVENAVNAMQGGATNFIQKPWDNEKLLADVRTAVGRRRAEEEVIQLKRALKQRYNFEHIIGKSEPMLRIFDLVAQVAPSRSTVLLQGESGTGKELIAKAIHMNSTRKDRAFVPVNTGSTPADLLESTLFGHVKGAFTSAIASKKGLFEVADRGTLFLDEIGTMNLETQAKILRVLQDRKFMHLGGVNEIQVDVRIIAATNVDLRQQVKEGKFREDLFYRLNVITIDLPPLRQRKNDIPLLVEHFIAKFAEENERPAAARDAGSPAAAAGLRLARERARIGERDRARRGTGNRTEPDGRSSARRAGRPRQQVRHHGPPSRRFAVRDHRRLRTPHHQRHAGEVRLEPDRSRRPLPHSALDPQPEDQAAEYRDQEEP